MDQTETIFRRTLRLPQDAADFVASEARRNLTSENAEIVRSIRERMQMAAGQALGSERPAAIDPTSPVSPGFIITQG